MSKLLNLKELSFGNANLIKDYFEKSDKYMREYGNNSILLMQVGSFFEVYGLKHNSTCEIVGSNIEDFSRICDLNVVEKNVCSASLTNYSVLMAGFKDFIIEKYIKKLQDAGFTSIVYVQDEALPNTTRSLHAIYSPGTFFSTDSTNITNNTLCVWVNVVEPFLGGKWSPRKIHIGAANINIYTGKSSIFEFSEIYINSPATFDELERFVSIYSPNEAIIIANLSLLEIDSIISYSNIQCSCIHKTCLQVTTEDLTKVLNCEKQTYQKQLLERFYTIDDFQTFIQNFNNNSIATQAFCYLLDFIYLHNPNLIHKISEPVFENCSDRLVLANHSLKQLNIIDDTSYTGKYSSVLKMLNCCITSMGKRHFSHAFLNPTTNADFLQKEYDIIEHLLEHPYPQMKEYLSGIKDISKINRQIMLKKIAPKSLFYFYQNVNSIKNMFKTIKDDEHLLVYLNSKTKKFSNLLIYCSELTVFLDKHFIVADIETIETYQNFETNFVQKGINSQLDEETRTLMESLDKLECCRNYFNQLVANYEKKAKTTEYIKTHETEKNNYSLIATDRRCKIIQTLLDSNEYVQLTYTSSYDNSQQTFSMSVAKNLLEIHKQTASNNAITTPQINQLCKSITSIKSKMKDLITEVYYC